MPDPERRAHLVTALAGVRARLADACAAAGRDPRGLTMVAVTKTFPASDIAALAELGVSEFGESRDQEARAKLAELGPLAQRLRWHFIGQLQTNKCRSVARYADVVHSVDRIEVARALDAGGERAGRNLEVFVQVSLDDDPARGGVASTGRDELVDLVAGLPQLRLIGLMAVAPLGADPDAAFARLAEISAEVRERHPQAAAISAGMSTDLEAAIRHGATHVRVGSALLGRRSATIG